MRSFNVPQPIARKTKQFRIKTVLKNNYEFGVATLVSRHSLVRNIKGFDEKAIESSSFRHGQHPFGV